MFGNGRNLYFILKRITRSPAPPSLAAACHHRRYYRVRSFRSRRRRRRRNGWSTTKASLPHLYLPTYLPNVSIHTYVQAGLRTLRYYLHIVTYT